MRVLIDACVLYPTVMRQMVLGVAETGAFEPRWSPRLIEEWARAAARLGPEHAAVAQGEIAQVQARFPEAQVPTAPEGRFWLPDPADIHVLATAVACSADVILTMNAKDFPRNILAEEGLIRADPDHFLLGLHEVAPARVRPVAEAVLAEAERLSGEAWTPRKLMKKARLPRLGKALERAS